MSTPARRQCSSATREPRSSPRRAAIPACTPSWLAAVATVTAPPPQEKANWSVKISSPGPGRAGTSPKTTSRKTVPKAITSTGAGSGGSLECPGGGVCLGDVARGAVLGQQLPQRRSDLVALFDGQRAAPAEPAARGGVDH